MRDIADVILHIGDIARYPRVIGKYLLYGRTGSPIYDKYGACSAKYHTIARQYCILHLALRICCGCV